jgi:hypothetical protein
MGSPLPLKEGMMATRREARIASMKAERFFSGTRRTRVPMDTPQEFIDELYAASKEMVHAIKRWSKAADSTLYRVWRHKETE